MQPAFSPLPDRFDDYGIELHDVLQAGSVELPLYRLHSRARGPAVLLLHGASAAAQTFLVPGGGLAGYMRDHGYDVWLLDWRGSANVVDHHGESSRGEFTFDQVAARDIPSGLRAIRRQLDAEDRPRQPIHVIAHCVGAGCLAASLGGGHIAEQWGLGHLVMSSLGLFYRAPWWSFLAAQDFILERIRASEPNCLRIHPGAGPVRIGEGDCAQWLPAKDEARGTDAKRWAWPAIMEDAYRVWPAGWLPPFPNSVGRRLAFMFGSPFVREKLSGELYNEQLLEQFGSMHLTLYLQAGQNVRRGFLAPFDSPSTRRALGSEQQRPQLLRYFDPQPFTQHRILLVTGQENQLWHRDSIDRMHEWLLRSGGPRQFQKKIYSGYGHQDMFWAKSARDEIFPDLLRHLQSPALTSQQKAPSTTRRARPVREAVLGWGRVESRDR